MRHASWAHEEALGTLIDYRIGFANIDQAPYTKAMTPNSFVTSAVGYVRLHGRNPEHWQREFGRTANPAAAHDYLYSRAELLEWKKRIVGYLTNLRHDIELHRLSWATPKPLVPAAPPSVTLAPPLPPVPKPPLPLPPKAALPSIEVVNPSAFVTIPWDQCQKCVRPIPATLSEKSLLANMMFRAGPLSGIATPTEVPADLWFVDSKGKRDGVREKLQAIVQAINATTASSWRAELWGYRLALIAKAGAANKTPSKVDSLVDLTLGGTNFSLNVRRYSLGLTGSSPFQPRLMSWS